MKAQGLRAAAALVRKHGQRKDSVLAHINPQEARFLKEHFGGDTNPHTGLPQYGLGKALKKVRETFIGKRRTNPHTGEVHRTGLRRMAHNVGAHKVEKAVRPIAKVAAPVVGSLVGTMLGGPAGAVMGGSLGGALSSKRHPLDHALGGALVGLGHSVISPHLAHSMNLNPDSMMANMMGMNAPTWGEQLGSLGSALGFAKSGAGAAQGASPMATAAPGLAQQLPAGAAAAGTGAAAPAAKGMLGGFGLKDALDAALLGTAIVGTVGGKTKTPKDSESIQDVMARISQTDPNDAYKGPISPARKKSKKPLPPGYKHGHDPEWEFFEDERTPDEGFAQGGYVKGGSGGQDDDVHMDIPAGAYVMDATTVSLLGDGNSDKGAEKVREMESKFMKTGIAKMHRHIPAKPIKAAVSDGEYIIPPEVVSSMGKGDNRKGSKVLDKMRKKLRAQKGVKKFLPPKSKHIDHYMR